MDFFNGIGKKVNQVVRSVSEKSNTSNGTARVQRELSELNAKCEGLFGELGKACFAAQSGEGDSNAVQAVIDRINEVKQRIEAAKEELDSLNGVRRCPECGAVLPREAHFCLNCGARQPEPPQPEPEPEPEIVAEPVEEPAAEPECEPEPEAEPEAAEEEKERELCPNCGAAREGDEANCTVCGQPFDGAAAEEESPESPEEELE